MNTSSGSPNSLNKKKNLFLKIKTQPILEYTRMTENTLSYFSPKSDTIYALSKMRGACNLGLWADVIKEGLVALKDKNDKYIVLLLAYAYSRIEEIEKSLFYIQKMDEFGIMNAVEFKKALNATELYFLSKAYLIYSKTTKEENRQLIIQWSKKLRKIAQPKRFTIAKPLKREERFYVKSAINHLTLNEMNLRRFPTEIKALKALVYLNLERNKIKEFPSELLDLKNLVELNLASNDLRNLPVEINRMNVLMQLDLGFNKFSLFPLELLELDKLAILNFQHNNIITLPSEIGRMKSLKSLNCEGMRLTILPKEIGELKNLFFLSFKFNRLKSLPPEIGKLTNLVSLNFANNKIKRLPVEISQLKNLSSLRLNNNELNMLSPKFCELNGLHLLDLSNNHLKRLPKSIEELSHLKRLNLANNLIGEAEKRRIKNLLPNCKITF